MPTDVYIDESPVLDELGLLLLPNTLVLSHELAPKTLSLDAIGAQFTLPVDVLVLDGHAAGLLHTLNEALEHNSRLSMLPNCNITPTGAENGVFLVIDLGGSTLRVAVIQIDPSSSKDAHAADRSNRVHVVVEKKWLVANSFKIIDANFFSWIGERIRDTIALQSVLTSNGPINTGITWSFPLEATLHNTGRICYVGKGFTISPEIYNGDLKHILESTLRAQGVCIDVRCVINDLLAVYAAGAFLDKYTKMAMVLGTGLNMCCSLLTDKMHPEKRMGQKKVTVNMEMSLFGDKVLLLLHTKYDTLIDSRFVDDLHFKPYMCTDPLTDTIFQPYELMTSGRYLPELARLAVCDLIAAKELFASPGLLLSRLLVPYDGFSGELMCMLSESSDLRLITERLCQEYGWDVCDVDPADVVGLKAIVGCIVKRAAYVVATSIVGTLKLMEHHNGREFSGSSLVKIGFVGSVLLYFHSYRDLILRYVNESAYVQQLGLTVSFRAIDDSSIIGAAIGAAYYLKEEDSASE